MPNGENGVWHTGETGCESYLCEETLDERSRLVGEVARQSHLCVRNLSLELLLVLVIPRRLANDHLIQEYAERPDVDRLSTLTPPEHLRGHVLGCPDEHWLARCGGLRRRRAQTDRSEPKVAQLDVAVSADEHLEE